MMPDQCQPIPLEKLPYVIARPDQSLLDHLSNMCQQIPSSISRFDLRITLHSLDGRKEKQFSIAPSFFSIYLKLVFSLHDFGKISPYFQQKLFARYSRLSIPKLPKACVPFSYHAQIGSLLAWYSIYILFDEFAEIIDDTICLKSSFVSSQDSEHAENSAIDDLLWTFFDLSQEHEIHDFEGEITNDLSYLKYFFATAGALSILMHHNRSLDNSTENIVKKNVRELRPLEAINGILKGIRTYLFESRNSRDNLLSSIFGPIEPKSYGWKYILSLGILSVILIPKDLEDIEDLIDLFDDAISDFLNYWTQHELETNFSYPLFFELVYSLLCETDEWDAKFYKIHKIDPQYQFERPRISLPPYLVKKYKRLRFPPRNHEVSTLNSVSTKKILVNNIRNDLFQQVDLALAHLDADSLRSHLFVIDAPTGSGKTLSLLHFGLGARNILGKKYGVEPRIIYCLPFISIIDQVGAVIQDVLEASGILVQKNPSTKTSSHSPSVLQSELLCLNHHLADSKLAQLESTNDEASLYEEFPETSVFSINDDLYEANSYHLINTWQPEIIVTSFVKFFNTICKAHKRELIRFHRLAGSIILIDEIQAIPAKYWRLIKEVLENLIQVLGCTIVLSSATSPVALTNLERLRPFPLFNPPKSITLLHRYNLHLKFLPSTISSNNIEYLTINDFATTLKKMITERKESNILVVLNTTRSAYQVYREVAQFAATKPDLDPNNVYLLSTQILPIHRAEILDELTSKLRDKTHRVILISTQVVEAGVDVSFDIVIRDFAPLDSIIQVAGRCNRNFENASPGEVHVYYLTDTRGRKYASMTYREHTIDLIQTQRLLLKTGKTVLSETELATLAKKYFTSLESTKKTMELFHEFKAAKFSTLFENFALIEEQDFNVTLVFHMEENSNLIKDLYYKRNLKHIPNRLRKYTLETSKSNFEWITKQIHETHYKTIKIPTDPDAAFHIIHLLQIPTPSRIYTARSGLVLRIEN